MKKLLILPIGKINQQILDILSQHLTKEFGLKAEIGEPLAKPDYAYNHRRRQYLSTAILKRMEKIERTNYQRILGVVDLDLYVPELNFVFGEADLLKKIAVISLTRLRPEFYGLPKDENLFKERAIKEAVHELGHTYGLHHCQNPKCVMHFSNTLLDTDQKSSSFCPNCLDALQE